MGADPVAVMANLLLYYNENKGVPKTKDLLFH